MGLALRNAGYGARRKGGLVRAGDLAGSHLCVVTDRECPDLTISKVVRLRLAPEIPAQGSHDFSYWRVHLWPFLSRCFFFVGFSVLRVRPCMKAEEGFKAPKHLFLYVFLKHLPPSSSFLNLTG